jgi:hypothetical protein
MRHLPIGRIGNRVQIVFKPADSQQSVVVGWLFGGRNAQPFAIRIESLRHYAIVREKNRPKPRSPPWVTMTYTYAPSVQAAATMPEVDCG